MKYTSYKLTFKATINGKEVKPKDIVFTSGGDCLDRPCYKENDYIIAEIRPGCTDPCIEGYILFGDSCTNCEPQPFKKCFCEDDSNCGPCEACINGGCESLCVTGEFCDGDKCVECDPNTPCKDGKICVDSKCVCPQGTFLKDGKCVECDEHTALTKCQECINGKIVYKVCDGECDPQTGNCVDCLNSGDCADREDGKGCCDGDHNCICCRGTVWDPKLGKCVAQPCKSDSECGDPCMICTPEGCKPIQCPDGYKCVNGECIYWPCLSTSCDNGADCGPECGCVEFEGVKQCVPCAYLQCNGLCEQALGCKCSENNTCVSSDNCSHVYCDNENPCQQPGCTCYEYTCVDCSNFPCTEGEGGCTSYEGCVCNDENKCEGGDGGCPNNGITLEKLEECNIDGNGCKLKVKIPKTSCKCDPIIFRTENVKTDVDCNINLAYTYDQPQIIPADNSPSPQAIPAILIIRTGMFKKVSNLEHPYANYKTNFNFADNELITGTVQVIVKHQIYVDGLLKPEIVTVPGTTIPENAIIDNKVAQFVLTSNHIKEKINEKSTFVTVEVWAKSIAIKNANCEKYESPKLIAKYELDYKEEAKEKTCQAIKKYAEHQITLVTDEKSTKYPRLTWYRTSTSDYLGEYLYNNTYTQKGWFRKLFVKTLEGNFWVDYINKPDLDPDNTKNGELINNYHYIVKTDCSCGNTTATHQNTHFCCPELLEGKYKIDNCGKKLILDQFDVCKPNAKLPNSVTSVSNTNYSLKVQLSDGTFITNQLTKLDNFKVNGTTVIPTEGKTIVAASVYQKYDGGILNGQELCVINLTIPNVNIPEPEKIVEGCDAGITTLKYIVKKQTGEFETDKVYIKLKNTLDPVALTFIGGQYEIQVLKTSLNPKGDQDGIVKYKNGCEKNIKFTGCGLAFTATPQT